jgi:hypothetical protein
LTSGEYAVHEQVPEFVAFTEGGVECIENIDQCFVAVDLRILQKVGASLRAEVGRVRLSWFDFFTILLPFPMVLGCRG